MNDLEFDYKEEFAYTDRELMDNITHTLSGDSWEVRLWLEVMKSAGEAQDLDYFLGDTFKLHCNLIGLDDEVILEAIVKKKLITAKRKSTYTRGNSRDVREEVLYKREVENLSVLELAEEYGVCPKTIRRLLDPLYVKPASKAFKGQQANIIQDYFLGVSVPEIVEKYNMSSTTVYRALKGSI